ncbi:hypothetical protein HII28_02810 [Planctomonas sp. JC2975]|uniref:hypothetical protein n=1 Tax=Planctomonas sp. JC2975 TaxID=2729626 RepID=UPI001474D885|nr:hypothetical protein [Planctomonas sp. JC2975]NNC10813.1 hypothetical protein [Planctomonas sp. JC2975]
MRPRAPRYEELSFDSLLAASHAGGPANAAPAEDRAPASVVYAPGGQQPAVRPQAAPSRPAPSAEVPYGQSAYSAQPGAYTQQPTAAPQGSPQQAPAPTSAPWNSPMGQQAPSAPEPRGGATYSPTQTGAVPQAVDGHPLTRRELRAMMQAQTAGESTQTEADAQQAPGAQRVGGVAANAAQPGPAQQYAPQQAAAQPNGQQFNGQQFSGQQLNGAQSGSGQFAGGQFNGGQYNAPQTAASQAAQQTGTTPYPGPQVPAPSQQQPGVSAPQQAPAMPFTAAGTPQGAPAQPGQDSAFAALLNGGAEVPPQPPATHRVIPPAAAPHEQAAPQVPISVTPSRTSQQGASAAAAAEIPQAGIGARASGGQNGPATDPQLAARAAGHWSTMNDDDAGSPRSAVSTGSVTTANALILPSVPSAGLATAPLTSTGEVIVTGSIELPRSLGSTGQHPDHFDSSDIDRLFEESDAVPNSSVAPVRASKAVATHTSTRGMITPPSKRGNRLPVVLAVTAGFMALGVTALLVAGYVFHAF